MAPESLKNKHLADLHEIAAERGVETYRMLTRQELLAELGEDADEESGGGGRGSRGRGGRRRGRRGRGGDGGRDDRRRSDRDDERDQDDDPGEPISGVLEITSRGHGFIRLDDPDSEKGDIYVSPSQIRRCELQAGDQITGPARRPRRGERHPALVHIDTVNGAEPGGERSKFEELEAIQPHRRLPLAGATGDEGAKQLLRSIDLLAPLARGQRVLVNCTRGSGRTTLLRALAAELAEADDLETLVVLIDERPEEETEWRKALPDGSLEVAGADMRPREQLRLVELAVARAKRKAEGGDDVVLLIDSLSRLAVAADDPGAAKPIFAAGRETASEDAGSLTVIATVLTGDDDGGVAKALGTTENVTLTLDGELAEAGIFPALAVGGCRVTREEELRSEPELAGARALRAELAGLPARDAAERLRERLAANPTTETLLAKLAE